MPLALDMPPQATAVATGSFQHGFPTTLVACKNRPRELFFNVSDYYGPSIRNPLIERMLRDANKKIEAMIPIYEERIAEAMEHDDLKPFNSGFAQGFNAVLQIFALNPNFSALSFSVTDDGEFELVRVDKSRTVLEYLTVGQEDDSSIYAMFSRFENSDPVFNTVGSLTEVMTQIVRSQLI